LLPYKNTKLRRRRRGKEALGGNIHGTGELWILRQASCRGRYPSTVILPPPLPKKPALRLYPLVEEKEEKEKEGKKRKKSSIWRSIAILINIGHAAVL